VGDAFLAFSPNAVLENRPYVIDLEVTSPFGYSHIFQATVNVQAAPTFLTAADTVQSIDLLQDLPAGDTLLNDTLTANSWDGHAFAWSVSGSSFVLDPADFNYLGVGQLFRGLCRLPGAGGR
jgi:hypothetical protein